MSESKPRDQAHRRQHPMSEEQIMNAPIEDHETISSPTLPASIALLLRDGAPTLSEAEIETIYGIATMLYRREQYAQAGDLFRLLVLCRPRDARSWLALGASHEAIGDDERAIALYEVGAVAPEGTSDRVRAQVYLARVLVRQRRALEAREWLDKIDEGLAEGELDPGLTPQLAAVRREVDRAAPQRAR